MNNCLKQNLSEQDCSNSINKVGYLIVWDGGTHHTVSFELSSVPECVCFE